HPREAEGAGDGAELPVHEPAPARELARIAGKAPSENVFEKLVRHRSAIREVTRSFMVNHWLMAEPKTVRLDVTGPLARLTLDRPEVLNAGDARFARELKEVVAALGARPEVRVVVVTGEGRAYSTGVDLGALAHGEFGMADFVLWEDAMTAMERMDT